MSVRIRLPSEFEAALRRFADTSFDQLDRILVTIWGIEAEVNNGGFDQYYFNGAGDQAFFAPDALRAIGALRMSDIASRANAKFGRGGPPGDRDQRHDRLFEIAPRDADVGPWDQLDGEFLDYPDDIAALLIQFLRASRGRRVAPPRRA
jgi:hypothetical protein